MLELTFAAARSHVQNLPHFKGKSQIWEHVKSLQFPHSTSVEAAYFFNNWEKFGAALQFNLTIESDGSLQLQLPCLRAADKIPGFDVASIGKRDAACQL